MRYTWRIVLYAVTKLEVWNSPKYADSIYERKIIIKETNVKCWHCRQIYISLKLFILQNQRKLMPTKIDTPILFFFHIIVIVNYILTCLRPMELCCKYLKSYVKIILTCRRLFNSRDIVYIIVCNIVLPVILCWIVALFNWPTHIQWVHLIYCSEPLSIQIDYQKIRPRRWRYQIHITVSI